MIEITAGFSAALAGIGMLASAEHGEGATSPFAGDVGTAIWTLVIFVLVLVVLGKFAWGPILRGLQKREDFIFQQLQQAKQEREQAAVLLADYSTKLQAAQAEASAIVAEGRRDAEVLRAKLEQQGKANGEALLERARREINLATDAAVKDLYTLSARLATDVAARVIGKELTAQDHERLIAESIEQIGRLNRN
ncbi:MAG TPA: F0F1 ATP synthase subunit B [Phycisphaerae bacterium]|nr:F0F1 ATP synthase subunit B [Phycisphaerae bacterium]HNU45045.1 F0F1 ATP synthase subunit B [Phycisphaerae bacterium]